MNVPRHEKLTHFINDEDNFYSDNITVKYRAFIPQSKSPQEISVYRISSLIGEESKVWEIGKNYVEKEAPRKIIARADFFAYVVYEHDLEVVENTQVHELHANIQPIPLDREDRDVILRALALASKLVFRPPEDT